MLNTHGIRAINCGVTRNSEAIPGEWEIGNQVKSSPPSFQVAVCWDLVPTIRSSTACF